MLIFLHGVLSLITSVTVTVDFMCKDSERLIILMYYLVGIHPVYESYYIQIFADPLAAQMSPQDQLPSEVVVSVTSPIHLDQGSPRHKTWCYRVKMFCCEKFVLNLLWVIDWQ